MLPDNPIEIQHGPYKIQQSDQDPLPLERRPLAFCTSNLLTWGLWLSYILVQLNFTRLIQGSHSYFMWRMWVIPIAELCLSFQEMVWGVNLLFALFCAEKGRSRPRYCLIGEQAPTIDILITCCGEPVKVILDTIIAAISQDYPPDHFRVFLLDDGHDEDLKIAVEYLNKESAANGGPRTQYLSRKVESGVKSYFKAGNLQFGIEETKRLGGSEFLASLDADMIPERDWLRRIVPHLILGGDIALGCPPQRYYNVPDYDPLGQQAEFDLYFTIYEPLNDQVDAAMCTGSGYIIRRSALADIGGWPQVEVGEDFMCSAVMSNNGWKVAFIRENLQFGLAPDSMRSYINQRTRWVDSGIEVHKQFGFYLPGSRMTSQLTWVQRGVGILQALREYAPITNIMALFSLPLALLPVQHDEHTFNVSTHELELLWGIFMLSLFVKRVNNYLLYSHVGVRRVENYQSVDIWCAPYSCLRCLISFLPASAYSLTFDSCGSITSPVNERSELHRASLTRRLLSLDMLMYPTYIIYASLPFILRILIYRTHTSSSGLNYFVLFPGAILKLVDCIAKVSVPFWYMTFPPTVPERDELMETDDQGVRRSKNRERIREDETFGWLPIADIIGLCLIWWTI